LESDIDKNFKIMKDESDDNLIRETKVVLYLKKKILVNFSKKRRSMTWSKKFRIFWYQINLYYDKTKKEDVNDEENEGKTGDEEKVTEV
jgi:hypothetical protein